MVQKTYYKTKDYCKVKFSFKVENAEDPLTIDYISQLTGHAKTSSITT